ncbi:MAG: S24 family peptidase [Methylococcales bacterium]
MSRKQQRYRLENLERLVVEASSAHKLAKLANTNSSYLSQVRHQRVTESGTPRGIGDVLAEKLEIGMGKPPGWMDEPHELDNQPNTLKGPTIHRQLPLINWVQAGNWTEINTSDEQFEVLEYYPCPIKCSPRSFVLRVQGSSMEPKFTDGDLIFVDPDVEAVHGKFVVVQLNDTNQATFKQLIVENNQQFLRAVNPDWPQRIIAIEEEATICGVVVFKGEVI